MNDLIPPDDLTERLALRQAQQRAERPAPLSGAERQRRYRTRKRNKGASPSQAATVTLRPREMRVIAGIAEGQSVRAALRDAGFSNGHSGSMEERLRPGGDLAFALAQLLDSKRVGMERLIEHAESKLTATRVFNAARGRDGAGRVVTECIEVEDNDAQLRANEHLVGLHERAGTIPAGHVSSGTSVGQITVNIVQYASPSQGLAAPAAQQQHTVTLPVRAVCASGEGGEGQEARRDG